MTAQQSVAHAIQLTRKVTGVVAAASLQLSQAQGQARARAEQTHIDATLREISKARIELHGCCTRVQMQTDSYRGELPGKQRLVMS